MYSMLAMILFLVGLPSTLAAAIVAVWLVGPPEDGSPHCARCARPSGELIQIFRSLLPGTCSNCHRHHRRWPWLAALLGSGLFACYGWMLIDLGCQTVTEVRPSSALWQNRLPFSHCFSLAAAGRDDH
jgi:hypothetical protein